MNEGTGKEIKKILSQSNMDYLSAIKLLKKISHELQQEMYKEKIK
ncbi:hypothetical protein [Carnobacterium maltaromaticum]|nr:hypothetical protein [Carnobacterium maltaromaticum]